jgi:chromosome segregation ATPase
MKQRFEDRLNGALWGLAGALVLCSGVQAQGTVYRCPGNPVLYTDTISAKEAQEKGCKPLEGAPITIVPSLRPRTSSGAAAPSAASTAGAKVDPDTQRGRDSERRTILEAELKKEEKALAELQAQYNNGEPERKGDERNYQKYLERVNELKASVARKEADIAALKREIAKLP